MGTIILKGQRAPFNICISLYYGFVTSLWFCLTITANKEVWIPWSDRRKEKRDKRKKRRDNAILTYWIDQHCKTQQDNQPIESIQKLKLQQTACTWWFESCSQNAKRNLWTCFSFASWFVRAHGGDSFRVFRYPFLSFSFSFVPLSTFDERLCSVLDWLILYPPLFYPKRFHNKRLWKSVCAWWHAVD